MHRFPVTFLTLSSFILVGSIASAQDVVRPLVSCNENFASQASGYWNYERLIYQGGGIPQFKACEDVRYSGGSHDVQRVVYLTSDEQSLVIQDDMYVAPSGKAGYVRFTAIPSGVAAMKSLKGRMVIVTYEGNLVFVGRNGDVVELLNRNGESYSEVAGGKIKGITITEQGNTSILNVQTERNGSFSLDEEMIDRRIIRVGGYRYISLF